MKKNWINNVKVQGYVYDHTLTNRESGPNSKNPGTPFIMGDLQVATDDDAMNIVTIHFSYVTETYAKSGKANATYGVLQKIIDGEIATYKTAGTDAQKVEVNGSLEVNDFYTNDGELASPKRIGGSFVNLRPANFEFDANPATFDLEMIIYNCAEKEVENGDDYVQLTGYAFNFRNDILPVALSVQGEAGQKYFLDADISKTAPMVTKVWGVIKSTTVVEETEIESAFGAPTVKTTTRTFRAWDVIGASAEPMEWDDEDSITKKEFKACQEAREEYLAGVKKRQDEYRASQAGKSGFPASGTEKKEDDVDDDYVF